MNDDKTKHINILMMMSSMQPITASNAVSAAEELEEETPEKYATYVFKSINDAEKIGIHIGFPVPQPVMKPALWSGSFVKQTF